MEHAQCTTTIRGPVEQRKARPSPQARPRGVSEHFQRPCSTVELGQRRTRFGLVYVLTNILEDASQIGSLLNSP
jgi:hypothetical protein